MATGVLGRRWGTGTEQGYCMRCGLGSPHTLPDHQIAVRTAQVAEERARRDAWFKQQRAEQDALIARRRAGALVPELLAALPDPQVAVRTAQDAERHMDERSKPEVNLSDDDGNVFSIIGRVRKALRRAGQDALVEEFTNKARAAQSYDAVLQLVFEYCEVN